MLKNFIIVKFIVHHSFIIIVKFIENLALCVRKRGGQKIFGFFCHFYHFSQIFIFLWWAVKYSWILKNTGLFRTTRINPVSLVPNLNLTKFEGKVSNTILICLSFDCMHGWTKGWVRSEDCNIAIWYYGRVISVIIIKIVSMSLEYRIWNLNSTKFWENDDSIFSWFKKMKFFDFFQEIRTQFFSKIKQTKTESKAILMTIF